ncbi:hypothetical protein LX81_02529 [Palleronia aestuarii]|uniref:Muramidase (Phage lysozyme) n=1 Tax=Palleronia aestuarii TaxID=568105 RepID=A0A2W7NPR0_9RHOB|nr:hypothetical protein [Palleronia aestuarii]PZX15226.1 hypothetical protein LX81_02529 [Palleronia aestuarii]
MLLRIAILAALSVILSTLPRGAAMAQGFSLLGEASFGPSRGSLIQARAEIPAPTGSGGSLFAGQAERSFFAPMLERESSPQRSVGSSFQGGPMLTGPGGGGPAAQIRHLIASAEAGKDGYDAVQHGARVRPSKRPTEMTIGEIYDWIEATPGQPHAIGRYQFIPSTLRRLVDTLGLSRREVFSPWVQDALADLLLDEAGFQEAKSGGIHRHSFMNNLAKIWAGLPNSSGRSHYHGYAGNKATMAWARFDEEMARLFPS